TDKTAGGAGGFQRRPPHPAKRGGTGEGDSVAFLHTALICFLSLRVPRFDATLERIHTVPRAEPMHRSVVRLVAFPQIPDPLRDRRTMFLILGLPVLMYPLFVGVGLVFVSALKDKKLVVGVVGTEHLPKPPPDLTPVAGGPAGAAAEARAFPPLLVDGKFP